MAEAYGIEVELRQLVLAAPPLDRVFEADGVGVAEEVDEDVAGDEERPPLPKECDLARRMPLGVDDV